MRESESGTGGQDRAEKPQSQVRGKSRAGRQYFADFTRPEADRYDAWYRSASGRRVASDEEMLLGSLLGGFSSLTTVLEVGSGTGHFSRWFASHGLSVTGLDMNRAMVETATEAGCGPTYLQGDAEALPLHDRSVDLVTMITALEFVPDAAAAVREAARVARLGLLFGVLNLASPLGVERKVRSLYQPTPYRNAHFFTPRGLQHLVRNALAEEAVTLRLRTAVWPDWVPQAARALPIGAFIGLAVMFGGPHREK